MSKSAATVIPLPTSETKVEDKTKLKKKPKAGVEAAAKSEAEAEDGVKYRSEIEISKELESAKWYLWHGNVLKSLQVLEYLEFDLEGCELEKGSQAMAYQKVLKGVREFRGYIATNQTYTVNYGDRYRNGERISSSLAESTVDQVISKRFVKSQKMRWTKKGVHLLLQVRTRVLNGELEETFQRWYPCSQIGLERGEKELEKAG